MKKIYTLITLISLLASMKCNSQQDHKWLLGYNSVGGFPDGNIDMDFSNNQLDSAYFHYRNMNFEFTNVSICDSNGTLLFCSNGVYIANAQDDTMLNGSGLNPSFYTTNWYNYGLNIPQADIITPKPGSDSLYYLFHETNNDFTLFRPYFLYHSIINMRGDSGQGQVIVKNQILINDTLVSGCLTATKHGNGRDWWLVVPEYGNDGGFYILLITPDTIEITHHLYFGLNHLGIGQACFSPDGSKYVWNTTWDHTYFYDFDRCTGLLSNPQFMYYADSIYWIGASASPNSQYAYVSHGPYVFQFDLYAVNIPGSLDTVAINDGFADPYPPYYTAFVLHQLAPDGKIYISHGNSTMSLHVIDDPDSAGTACDVQQHAVQLPRFNVTIPNFPNYNLGALAGSICDSLTAISDFEQGIIKFEIYPNPTDGNFNISYQLPENKSGELAIFNYIGEKVFSYRLPQWSTMQRFDLSFLASGIYTVKISGGGRTGVKKLVKV